MHIGLNFRKVLSIKPIFLCEYIKFKAHRFDFSKSVILTLIFIYAKDATRIDFSKSVKITLISLYAKDATRLNFSKSVKITLISLRLN